MKTIWTRLLEAAAGQITDASVLSDEAQKIISSMEKGLKKWLDKLMESFPMAQFLQVYYRKLRAQEQLDVEFSTVFTDWVDGENELLTTVLNEHIEKATRLGWKGTMQEFVDQFGLGQDAASTLVGALPDSVLADVEVRVATLVDDLADTTITKIGNIVSNGLEARLSVDEMARQILDFTDDDQLTLERAQLIARAEVNEAVSRAAFEGAKAVGADEKDWNTVGDDRVSEIICLPNGEQGRVKIDRAFQSGHTRTPGHPLCRCTVLYFGVDIKKLRALAGVA